MKSVDELTLQYRANALKEYQNSFKNAPKAAIKQHLCDTLQARLQKELPDSNIYVYNTSATIYLYGKDNVGKDIELAFEKHDDLIRLFGGEFKSNKWNGDSTMTYKWEKYSIDVNISGSTTCSRIKVGTKSRTINEDVYDIICE